MSQGHSPDGCGVAGISAVVVNYKAADLTVAAVASLRADGVAEMVVVDGASGDDCEARLAEADPAATYVALASNRGYGAAVNIGMARTSGWAVIVSNPDLVVTPGTVAALAEDLAANSRVAVVGPRIDRPDGSRYPSARAFPSLADAVGHGFVGLMTTDNPWSRRYLRADQQGAGPADWVSGAFFATRRTAWDEVGGFDESYFMFMEDVDLCWRLRRSGWRVTYQPAGRVTHVEGASRATAPYRMILAHHRSLLIYEWRAGGVRVRLLAPLVAAGLVVRTAILCLRTAATDGRRNLTARLPRSPHRLP